MEIVQNTKQTLGFSLFFFRFLRSIEFAEIYFSIVRRICITKWYFEYRIRILCIFLYMGTYFEDVFDKKDRKCSHKCEQCSYELFVFFVSFGIWGPKWSPYVLFQLLLYILFMYNIFLYNIISTTFSAHNCSVRYFL